MTMATLAWLRTTLALAIISASLTGCQSMRPKLFAKKSSQIPNPTANQSQGSTAPAQLLADNEAKPEEPVKPTPELFTELGRVRASLQQYPESIEYYEKALKLNPHFEGAIIGIAQSKMAMGHADQAVSVVESALSHSPKSAPLWNEHGIAQAKLEKYHQALQSLEKARALDPKNPLYTTNLASILTVTGDLNRAIKLYSQVVSRSDAHLEVARILQGMGKRAESREQVQSLLSQDPTNVAALEMIRRLEGASVTPVQYQPGTP